MDIEDILKETLEELLNKLEVEYSKIDITEEDKGSFEINIHSENPSLLIGHHGDNIQALQHILKTLIWRKAQNEQFNIMVDVDDYRKRQEENVLNLAERKIEYVRKTGRSQTLPPMSPYLRRKIHMLCMSPGYDDVETISEGEADQRYIIIKLKS
ncbi:MAG: R3H domain-containing nucleic acid-binding protein [Nitrospirota bacterium]